MAASTSPTLSPGATLADRYEILSHVRSGVLSEVYRAAVKGSDQRVEVTVLRTAFASAELPKRIERELKRVAELSLRAVPALREVFSDPAGLVVVVDAPPDGAEPRSMRARVDADGAMEPSEVSRVISEVAGVLDAMHQGLAPPHLHRRINPDTVRTLASGEVEVLECGLGHALVATGVVTPRIPMQSRQYLSPDELLQRPSVRADLFALTSLAFECLTGTVAFQGPTEASLSAAILRGPRPSVCALRDDLPSEVDAVFARGWAQEPSKAFPNATELAEALREVVARQSTPGSLPPPKPVPPRRNPATNATLQVGGSVPPPLSDSEKAALGSPPPPRAPRPLNPTQKVLVPRIHAPGTERLQDDDDAIIDAAIRTVAPRPDPTDPPPPMRPGAPRSNPPSDGWVDLDAKSSARPRAASTSSPPTEDPSGRRRFGTLVSSVPPPPPPSRARDESSPKLNVHAPIPRARPSSVPPPCPSDRTTSVPPPRPPARPAHPGVAAQPTEDDPGEVTFDLSADPDEIMPSAPPARSVPPPPSSSKPPVSAAPSPPSPAPSPEPLTPSHEMDPEEEVESFELSPSLDASPPEEPVTTPPPEPVTIPIPVPAPVFDPVPPAQPAAPAVDPAAVFTPPTFAPPSAPYAPPVEAAPAPSPPNVPSWQPVAEPPAPPRKPALGRRVAVLGGVLIGFAIAAIGGGLYLNRDRTNDTPPAPTRLPPRPVVAAADVTPAAEVDAVAVAAIDDASAGDAATVAAASLDAAVADDVTAVAAMEDASAATEDAAVAAVAVDAGAVASADVPPSERRRHPRRRDMRAMEASLRDEVLTCVGGEHRRRVHVTVTYAGETGQPTAVNVSGIYAEPPIGPCIEGVFRRHPVDPFTEEEYEARFTFRRRSHHDDEDEEE
ncbi:MAG: hypothetical protein R3A52_08360 [Polyangiales bacterium]